MARSIFLPEKRGEGGIRTRENGEEEGLLQEEVEEEEEEEEEERTIFSPPTPFSLYPKSAQGPRGRGQLSIISYVRLAIKRTALLCGVTRTMPSG